MKLRSLLTVVAVVLGIAPVAGAAPTPVIGQDRSVDPVVLTGTQFPTWSAGPDPTFREPQTPTNYDTADSQQYFGPAQSDCYQKSEHPNPYDYSDNGDHNCYQASRIPSNPREGADVQRLLGYRWNGAAFEQIPFQVDERFTRYISNNRSGFAFYSGVDQETTYAWDNERFRFTSDEFQENGGNPCLSRPANGVATTPDPIKGLDDNDELAFMYSDAGTQAPPATALPSGIDSSYEITVADPSNPGTTVFVYVMLATPTGPTAAFDASNGYVRYLRDTNADMFVYSQSSYDGYGAAPKGPYCDLDGNVVTTPRRPGDVPKDPPAPNGWAIEQRRPLDTAWVKTDRYTFRYEGRWLMTELHISPSGHGLTLNDYGPDIIDQWKARAFQQRPGGTTPCCGYEEEVNNWGGSSILFGERVGPVRAIRAAWGADSSTNNVKIETFYREDIRFDDALRVHVIPPADGIYVQWDYNAGKVATYYNPIVSDGVPIDGKNDEVFGNTNLHVAQDRIEIRDDDPIPVVGPQHITAPGDGSDPNRCDFGSEDGICNDLDFADPTFSGPAGDLNWEEIAGPYGSLVTRWTIKEHSGGDAYSLLAQPYYRDDSCFDDGTGSDPGPHLRGRGVDNGSYATYTDENGDLQDRVCWDPAKDGDPAGSRKFWQGDIATHGLHIQLIADSDNANLTVPVDEIVSEQRMVVLPGEQENVGDQYGRSVEFPLQTVARPFA